MRTMLTLALALLVQVGWAGPPTIETPQGVKPQGLYVYSYPSFIKNGAFERALQVKGVSGAAVVMNWADIEPERDVYDFTEFDRRVRLIASHGLAIELGILAGGNAPDWIYRPSGRGQAAQKLHFVFAHHAGQGKTVDVTMAPPWDPAYQAAFADMLAHLAQHLRESGALDRIAVVKLTGINTDTDEIRVPAEVKNVGANPAVTDAREVWLGAGYRPSLMVQAMKGIASAWTRNFAQTWKVLPIIPQDALPPIGEDGKVVQGQRAKTLVRDALKALVVAAQSETRDRFILQMDWLMADQPVRPLVMEFAKELNTPVAWQTNFYLGRGGGNGAACGGTFGQATPCDDASYLRLLESGMHPDGGTGPSATGAFIEIFPPDAIAFEQAVARAHDRMFGPDAQAPERQGDASGKQRGRRQ